MADLDRLNEAIDADWTSVDGMAWGKARVKVTKRLAHNASAAFDAGERRPERLALFMSTVRQAIKVHGFPEQLRRELARITAAWLEATGTAEHRVMAKKRRTIAVESGMVAVGDPAIRVAGADTSDLLEGARCGARLSFGTGADGLYSCMLRLVDASVPVLAPKEYQRLTSSTETIVLDVPSGRVVLADLGAMIDANPKEAAAEGVALDVPPGRYAACAFAFSGSKHDRVIAVLARTDELPSNEMGVATFRRLASFLAGAAAPAPGRCDTSSTRAGRR